MRFIIHVPETKIVPYRVCNGVLNGFMRELLIWGMAVINSEPYSYRVSFPVAVISDSCTVHPQCRSLHVLRPLNIHICVRFNYCKSAPVFAMSQTRVASLIALYCGFICTYISLPKSEPNLPSKNQCGAFKYRHL